MPLNKQLVNKCNYLADAFNPKWFTNEDISENWYILNSLKYKNPK